MMASQGRRSHCHNQETARRSQRRGWERVETKVVLDTEGELVAYTLGRRVAIQPAADFRL
jgi:hypothetical protein